MKKSLLLSMLMATGLSVCAQTNILSQGFEDGEISSDPSSVGYIDYINWGTDNVGTPIGNHHEISSEVSLDGSKSLYVRNDSTMAGSWVSAVWLRNIPVQPNTSYRVTYYAMANEGAKLCTTMQCGVENSDVPFVGKDNTQFRDEYDAFNMDGWTKRTTMFYYTNDDIQKEYYLTQGKQEPTMPAGYFVRLSMYSEGEYYVDNVSLDQSSIAGITYAVDALRINTGYKLDCSAAKVGAPAVLDASAAKVLIDGEEAGIETVELHADGYVYIYLDSEIDADANPKVEVSFTNPKGDDGFKYLASEACRPFAWEDVVPYMLDFSGEVAEYDSEGDYGFSYLYEAPKLVSANPENGSFDLSNSINTFTFVFNKEVNLSEVRAKLGDEDLQISTAGEFASTVTFTRATAGDLPTGVYYLTVSNIQPEKFIDGLVEPGEVEVKLGIGKIDGSGEDPITNIFEEKFDAMASAGVVPIGWKTTNGLVDGEDKDINIGSSATGKGNSRVMGPFTGAAHSWDYAMYIRHGAGGTAYASYGGVTEEEAASAGVTDELPRLYLETGNYQLSYDCAQWARSGSTCQFDVLVYGLENGVEVGSDLDVVVSEPYIGESMTVSFTATTKTLDFVVKEPGNYVLKFLEKSSDGYTGLLLSNIKLVKIADIPGAKEKAELAAALTLAETAYATVCDPETSQVIDKYNDNVTTTGLKTLIDEAKAITATSPTEYKKLTADLAAKTLALNNHRDNVDAYYVNLQAAGDALVNWDATKYMSLSSYAVLQKTYNEYKDQILKDDATLVEVNSLLLKNTMELNNMAGWGVGLLTERLNHLTALATELGIDENDELIVKANDALTDDGALAWQLASKCEVQLYANFLAGVDYFSGEHEGERDSLNMTGYIRNPEMYIWTDSVYTGTTSPEAKIGTLANFCPGWSDEGSTNSYGNWTIHMANTGQGGADLIEKNNCPVVDPVLKTWSALADIHQEVTNLPVGKYRMFTRSSNQNPDTEADPLTVTCNQHLYAIVNGDSIGAAWNPTAGQWFGSGRKAYTSYIDFDVKSVNSTVKIGIYSNTSGSGTNTFLKALNLYMIDKDPTFDYATNVEAGIATSKEVKAVNYYNINGMLMKEAQKGINIQKVIYEDGSVKINKILVK